jgi:hypothetical protein
MQLDGATWSNKTKYQIATEKIKEFTDCEVTMTALQTICYIAAGQSDVHLNASTWQKVDAIYAYLLESPEAKRIDAILKNIRDFKAWYPEDPEVLMAERCLESYKRTSRDHVTANATKVVEVDEKAGAAPAVVVVPRQPSGKGYRYAFWGLLIVGVMGLLYANRYALPGNTQKPFTRYIYFYDRSENNIHKGMLTFTPTLFSNAYRVTADNLFKDTAEDPERNHPYKGMALQLTGDDWLIQLDAIGIDDKWMALIKSADGRGFAHSTADKCKGLAMGRSFRGLGANDPNQYLTSYAFTLNESDTLQTQVVTQYLRTDTTYKGKLPTFTRLFVSPGRIANRL